MLSEDLLPGVSVIDLRVVDYSTLRLETGYMSRNLKLGLRMKWTQMKLGCSLAGRNDKDTNTKKLLKDTN